MIDGSVPFQPDGRGVGPVRLSPMDITSPHQQAGPCAMCEDDATKYNHCAWCGTTLQSLNQLASHIDECLPGMIADFETR